MRRPTTRGDRRRRPLRAVWTLLFTAIGVTFALAGPAAATIAIHVQGNQLVDAEQRPIRLLGVNFSGAEYACVQEKGIWNGAPDQATIAAMVAWHVNAVRIPLNEDCWLGIGGVPAAYSGGAYQQAIHEFVEALHQAGIYAILDLHWNAPAGEQATSLREMADADHSPDFWRSVALSFREDPAVMFDLYSEPHAIDWGCWLSGCTVTPPEGEAWSAAGMQSLVDAVRSQGATQPLLLGGVDWANDLSGWLAHLPHDPEGQLVASFHVYPNNACNSLTCWSGALAQIAARHPVVAGEIGEFDCGQGFVDGFMDWADAEHVSYLGWSWNAFDCASGPSLISSADGTPTAYGQGLRERLRRTSTTVSSSAASSPLAQPVTLLAQVEGSTSVAAPGGFVQFSVDGSPTGPLEALDASGRATLTLAAPGPGLHIVTASYGGDGAFAASTSAPLGQTFTTPPPEAKTPEPSRPPTSSTLMTSAAPVASAQTPEAPAATTSAPAEERSVRALRAPAGKPAARAGCARISARKVRGRKAKAPCRTRAKRRVKGMKMTKAAKAQELHRHVTSTRAVTNKKAHT